MLKGIYCQAIAVQHHRDKIITASIFVCYYYLNKMAASIVFALFTAGIVSPSWSEPGVSVSLVSNPVTVGGILALNCQVSEFQEDLSVNLFRAYKGRTEHLTSGKDILRDSERLNMFLADRRVSDGSVDYFLTIIDVSENDQGEYRCKIFDQDFNFIAENSIDVAIYSYPAAMYPICSSIPNEPITLSVMDRLTLKCTSEVGVPSITIQWMDNKMTHYETSVDAGDGNLINSELSIIMDDSYDGAVFTCEISNNVFPDWKRTCTIGPIMIKYLEENGLLTSKPVIKNKHSTDTHDTGRTYLHGKCEDCSSDEMLQLYLTAATIGTGFFAVIFIISTIVLCYKYHNISDVTRRRPSSIVATNPPVEPVYVSLQRRLTPEQREYMTLEDPNNPENKIILPKETFDDYCKTMTLKRV